MTLSVEAPGIILQVEFPCIFIIMQVGFPGIILYGIRHHIQVLYLWASGVILLVIGPILGCVFGFRAMR